VAEISGALGAQEVDDLGRPRIIRRQPLERIVDDHEESLPDPHQARGRRGLEIGDLRDRRRAAGLDVHSSSRLTCAAREDVVASARRSANIVDVIERSPIEMQASGGTLVASDDDTLLRGLPQPPLDGSPAIGQALGTCDARTTALHLRPSLRARPAGMYGRERFGRRAWQGGAAACTPTSDSGLTTHHAGVDSSFENAITAVTITFSTSPCYLDWGGSQAYDGDDSTVTAIAGVIDQALRDMLTADATAVTQAMTTAARTSAIAKFTSDPAHASSHRGSASSAARTRGAARHTRTSELGAGVSQ
jgi:hypothetical protein